MTNALLSTFHITKTVAIIFIIVAIVFNTAFVFTLFSKAQEAKAFLSFVSEMILAAIKRIIFNFVTNAIKSAFDFVMKKIQGNFLVKNFLRYDAVLADKRYYTDYITGNFPEGDTGLLLRDFSYQVNSGGRNYDPAIHDNITVRVNANGGFLPADPARDDYVERLTNLKNVWNNPTMVFFGMQDQSLKAQAEAKRASALNLTSEGLKTSFGGLGNDSVKTGTNTLAAVEEQTINAVYRNMSLAPDTSGSSFASLLGNALGNIISGFLFNFLNDQFNGGFVFRDDIPAYPPRFELTGAGPVPPEAVALPDVGPVPNIPPISSSCQFNQTTGEQDCNEQIYCQNNSIMCPDFNLDVDIDPPPVSGLPPTGCDPNDFNCIP